MALFATLCPQTMSHKQIGYQVGFMGRCRHCPVLSLILSSSSVIRAWIIAGGRQVYTWEGCKGILGSGWCALRLKAWFLLIAGLTFSPKMLFCILHLYKKRICHFQTVPKCFWLWWGVNESSFLSGQEAILIARWDHTLPACTFFHSQTWDRAHIMKSELQDPPVLQYIFWPWACLDSGSESMQMQQYYSKP